ncbi:MAG: phage portal protein [Alphaproteobacteria bacterium]|nr:phage portal protein [Alphaproteobacteria bacterium]
MFGQFRRLFGTESRSAEIDAGALFAAAFQFTGTSYSWTTSPALLVSSLSVPDGSGALLLESRRLAATSPLLRAYRNVIESGVLTGEPEPPTFPDTVPENITTAVGEMWMRLHDCDRERDLLDRCIVDGEFLELDDGTIIPPDGFEPVTAGPKWLREVVGYKIGTSSRARMAGLRYVGDRPAGTARALPWIGPALPSAAGLLNTRTGAAHGLGSLAKIAAVIANASPDRITANVGARSGLVQQAGVTEEQRQPIHALPVGSVPFLRSGEAVDRIEAGPDETARKYEAQLERDIASALNLPLSELLSDYSSGSFSNLRMAWQDAEREIARRRTWWHRHYRTPLYLEALSSAFAAGRLPRMNMAVMAQLKRPAWRGPVRQPPQPEKEAQTLGLLVDKGILTADDAREQLET